MSMVPFSKQIPPCPKCLAEHVKREYQEADPLFPMSAVEFLRLWCVGCGYYWKMQTADDPRKLKIPHNEPSCGKAEND